MRVNSTFERQAQWVPKTNLEAYSWNESPRFSRISVTSACNEHNVKRPRRTGSPVFEPLRHVARDKSISLHARTPQRASLDGNHPSKQSDWKDGPNGVLWAAEDIAHAVNGQVVTYALPGSISTDSRKLQPGEWFLALVGPNFDGHQFLPQALDRGCAGAIARAVSSDWPRGFVKVEDDTLAVLHRLAATLRRRYENPVVGITGSTGKTTTRGMVGLALESLGVIHQSEGNFNNHIGLPLTLLKLPSFAAACVLEMGMNHCGEILALSKIAQPSVRVILNVGPVHMEHFESLEEVAAAKGELLSGARPGDVCVLNADDPLVMGLPIPEGVQVVLFGRHHGSHVRIADARVTRGGRACSVALEHLHPDSIWMKSCSSGSQILKHWKENSTKSNMNDKIFSSWANGTNDYQLEYKTDAQLRPLPFNFGANQCSPQIEVCISSSAVNTISRVEFEILSPGLHLALNACAAAAVAVSLGVPLQTACKSLAKYSPIGMRSVWEEVGGGIQLINDAYNSNPMSIESSLKLLGSMDCEGRRIALLGDMLELGAVRQKAHLDALALCQELDLDIIGLVGPMFAEAARHIGLDDGKANVMIHNVSQELANDIGHVLRPGDVVLVKGSRGMQMEVVADLIKSKVHGS